MEFVNKMTDFATEAGVYLERAEHTIGVVVEEFFEDTKAHDDSTALNEARIMAELGRDCLLHLRRTLDEMKAEIDGAEPPDLVRQLEQLNVAALRTGKGEGLIAVLEKHGVTRFEDVPLGKYRALATELVALL
jgi:hypothetical protein